MVAIGFESRPSAVGEGREGCDPAGAAGVTWCIQVDVCGVGRSSREDGETWPGDAELYPVGAGKQKVPSLLYINSGAAGIIWDLISIFQLKGTPRNG